MAGMGRSSKASGSTSSCSACTSYSQTEEEVSLVEVVMAGAGAGELSVYHCFGLDWWHEDSLHAYAGPECATARLLF